MSREKAESGWTTMSTAPIPVWDSGKIVNGADLYIEIKIWLRERNCGCKHWHGSLASGTRVGPLGAFTWGPARRYKWDRNRYERILIWLRQWCEWLRASFTLEDLRRVIVYLQREIRQGRRNVGALKLSNLLQPDRFEEDFHIRCVRLSPPPPPKPPTPPPLAEPQRELRRLRALEQIRQIKENLR